MATELDSEKQKAYTPASEVCISLDTVVPTSMHIEQKRFSQKLRAAIGDVDQYVADKLKYKSKEELCFYFGREQVDGIATAIYNQEENRDGIIIADSTGTGKGRQAAGLIRYAILTLNKVPIFFTEKKHLINDIYRDLYDIGFDAGVPVYIKESTRVESAEISDAEIEKLIASDIRDDEDLRVDYEPPHFGEDFDVRWLLRAPKSLTDEELEILEGMKAEVIELYRQQIIEEGLVQDKYIKNPNYEEQMKKALKEGRYRLTPFVPNRIDIKNMKGDIIYPAIPVNELNVIYRKKNKGGKWMDDPKVDMSTLVLPKLYKIIALPYSQIRNPYMNENKTLTNKVKLISKYSIDNVIILDEAHNASGQVKGELTNTGKMIFNFVKNSGMTTYLSATYAKRADNMPLYALKTAIRECNLSDTELITAFREGKNALQEAVSAELTRNGELVRRERRIAGKTIYKYESESSQTGLNQIAHLNKVASLFGEVSKFAGIVKSTIRQLKKQEDIDIKFAGNVNRLRFLMFNFFLLGLKIKQTSEEAIEKLKSGKKTVIAIANTMESALNNMSKNFASNKDEDKYTIGDTIENDFKLYLCYMLNYTMRYKIKEEVVNDKGDKEMQERLVYILDAKDSVSAALKDALIEKFNVALNLIKSSDTGVYIAPIDMIKANIRANGFSIEEITGRQREIQFEGTSFATGTIERRKPKKTEEIIRDFNENKLDCVILNQSGAAGVSMHAVKAGQAQKVYHTPPMSLTDKTEVKARAMVVTQMELDVNKEVQKLGRINRTGQLYDPEYTYIISVIPSEKRLTALMEKKLRSLMANVSSNQNQAEDMFSADDFFSDVAVKPCKETIEVIKGGTIEVSVDSIRTGEGIYEITKLLYFKDFDVQNNFYKTFAEKLSKEIETLTHQGLYTGKMMQKNYYAEQKEVFPFYLGSNEAKTSFGRHSILERVEVTEMQEKYLEINIDAKIKDYQFIKYRNALQNNFFPTYLDFSRAAKTHVEQMIAEINKVSLERIENSDAKILEQKGLLEAEIKSQESFKDIHKAVALSKEVNEIGWAIREESGKVSELLIDGKMEEVAEASKKISALQETKKAKEAELAPLEELLERRNEIRDAERNINRIKEKIEDFEKQREGFINDQKSDNNTLSYILSYIDKVGRVYDVIKFEEEETYDNNGDVESVARKNVFSDKAVLVGVSIPSDKDSPLTLGAINLHFMGITDTHTLNLYKLHANLKEEDIKKGMGQEYELTEIFNTYKNKWNAMVGAIDRSYKSEKYIVSGNILRTFILGKDNGFDGQIIKYNTKDNKVRIGLEIPNKEENRKKMYDVLKERYSHEEGRQFGIYFDGNVANFEKFVVDYAYWYWFGNLYSMIDRDEKYDREKITYSRSIYFQISTKSELDESVFIKFTLGSNDLSYQRNEIISEYRSDHSPETLKQRIGERITKERFRDDITVNIVGDGIKTTNVFVKNLVAVYVDKMKAENPTHTPEDIAQWTSEIINRDTYEFTANNATFFKVNNYPAIERTRGGSLESEWWSNFTQFEDIFLTSIGDYGKGFQIQSRLKITCNQLLDVFRLFEEKRLKPTLITGSKYFDSIQSGYTFNVYLDEVEAVQEVADGETEFVPALSVEEEITVDKLIDELVSIFQDDYNHA